MLEFIGQHHLMVAAKEAPSFAIFRYGYVL